MATEERFIYDSHILDKTKGVYLTITIGNDQIGGSQLWFKDTPSTIISSGKITNLPLGNGNDLTGRTLCIKTNFYDRNPNTNNISATYNFNNGSIPLHVYYDHVINDKDFFVFHLEFKLN